MTEYIRSFTKIIPYLRESVMEVVENHPILGEKIDVPIKDTTVDVYLHRASRENAPVLFELHGGGFVLGHAAKDDALCELIKDRMNIHVAGINYRKAPENPYPAAIEDVMGVLAYFADHAEVYGMDPNKFAVMGFSAGANLATVAAMKSKDKERYHILCQILHYPFLDAVTNPYEKEKHPADLPCEVMEAFNELYSIAEERELPWISPINSTRDLLAGTAPAVILTAKEDALCNEGLHYAELLKYAEVPVEVRAMEYAHHGYIEDYYNPYCYEVIPEDTKASYHNHFEDSAQEAIEITINKLTEYLK